MQLSRRSFAETLMRTFRIFSTIFSLFTWIAIRAEEPETAGSSKKGGAVFSIAGYGCMPRLTPPLSPAGTCNDGSPSYMYNSLVGCDAASLRRLTSIPVPA